MNLICLANPLKQGNFFRSEHAIKSMQVNKYFIKMFKSLIVNVLFHENHTVSLLIKLF